MDLQALWSNIELSPVGDFVASSSWAFPTLETVHVIAIATVFGTVAIMDLRLLGLASNTDRVTDLSRDTLTWTWQMSLAALLYRAQDAGLMSTSTYQSAVKYMSRAGWRKVEPGDLGEPERPRLLRRAMKALEGNGVGLEQLADLAHIPVEEVQVYMTVPGSTGRVAVDF